MPHKYLDKFNLSSNDKICFPNTDEKDSGNLQERFEKQRKKYGFDERETWAMDFTLACWIYEHFKMYKKVNCIDLTYHKSNIFKWDEKKKEIIFEKKIEVNQEQAINLVLNNIKFYLTNNDFNKELESCNRFKYALYICAELMPLMWW